MIRGKNVRIKNAALSMRGSNISIKGDNITVIIGKGAKLNNVKITITGNNHRLVIGEGVRFVHGGHLKIEDCCNSIEIGNYTTINNAFLSCGDKNTSVNIGEDCLFSSEVILRTYDNHSIFSHDSDIRLNMGKSITLDSHVWVCYGVTILKGVKIGAGAIIGTWSVVTKDVPPHSIACGNPAKVIKENIKWDAKRKLD